MSSRPKKAPHVKKPIACSTDEDASYEVWFEWASNSLVIKLRGDDEIITRFNLAEVMVGMHVRLNNPLSSHGLLSKPLLESRTLTNMIHGGCPIKRMEARRNAAFRKAAHTQVSKSNE